MYLQMGSSGEQVIQLQQKLKSLGLYTGRIDGIFGPLTHEAVWTYQAQNGLRRDGIVGPQTSGSLGLSLQPPPGMTTGAGGPFGGPAGGSFGGNQANALAGFFGFGPSGVDATDDPTTRFNGLPGHPKVWKDSRTNKWYMVYTVNQVDPPVPLLFEVSSQADLKAFFGNRPVQADRTYTTDQIVSAGGIFWGATDSIPATTGDPWAGFTEHMERAAETQPWLRDPEVYSVYAGAWLQGRSVERWELEGTDWWQSHNEAQREWVWLSARDPEQAKEVLQANYINVWNRLVDLGVEDPNASIVTYISQQFTHGNWNGAYLSAQLDELVYGDGAVAIDAGLSAYMTKHKASLDDPAVDAARIRDEFRTWLGPGFTPSEDDVQRWGERLRRHGQYGLSELTQYLSKQRLAMFPEYKDASWTYEDIASPWRSFVTNTWGVRPDETEPTFMKILKLNDSEAAGQLLRKRGLERGYEKVSREAVEGLFDATGGQVRRAV